jgi:hypothetical protein
MRRRNPRRCASRTISPLSSRIARMNCTIQMLASTATRFPARVSTDTRRPTGASSSHSPCTPISLHARAGGRRTGALGGSARRGAGATPSRSERVGWLTGYDSPCRRFGVRGPVAGNGQWRFPLRQVGLAMWPIYYVREVGLSQKDNVSGHSSLFGWSLT